jgi:plastocyanin
MAKSRRLARSGLFLALGALACGRSITSSMTLLDPGQVRSAEAAMTIAASGVSPQVLHLDAPVTVTFTNRDSVAHRLDAAPELGYGDCPEMAQLGTLAPGQSGTVAFKRLESICGFHDSAGPANPEFQGLVVLH